MSRPKASAKTSARHRPRSSWRLTLRLNGKAVRAMIDPHRTLLDFLRIDLGLTGTKGACLEGECGSCYVLVDGRPANSCLMLAAQVQGREVTTIEGIAPRDGHSPVGDALVEHGAVQCGYCTPGIVVAAEAVRRSMASPRHDDWLTGIEGNLCRCTGYTRIVEALDSLPPAKRKRT